MQKHLFLFFLLIAGMASGTTPSADADAGTSATEPAATQPMQVWNEIKALRRLSENGMIPELDARGLADGYSEQTKMKIVRALVMSDEFSAIQVAKLNDVLVLLQCLRGKPIEKATITPECAKDGKVDRLLAHADKLIAREDRIMRAEAEKFQ